MQLQDFEKLIKNGESETVEFKAGFNKEAIETAVAFSNTRGGVIIVGGLHFPITGGRGNSAGIQFQTVMGTGKPVWQRITDEDLSSTITALNKFNPCKVFLSGHDSCDHSLTRMKHELKAETEVLRAGKTYRF